MRNVINRSVSIQELAPAILQIVTAGGTAELTVTGRSMLPMLFDRVSCVKLGAIVAPKLGDIILYQRDNCTYVLHRIVACAPDGTYTMCGDAQVVLEPKIRRDQMIAVVQSFARRNRWQDCENTFYKLWWHIHIADLPLRKLFCRAIAFLKRRIAKHT